MNFLRLIKKILKEIKKLIDENMKYIYNPSFLHFKERSLLCMTSFKDSLKIILFPFIFEEKKGFFIFYEKPKFIYLYKNQNFENNSEQKNSIN